MTCTKTTTKEDGKYTMVDTCPRCRMEKHSDMIAYKLTHNSEIGGTTYTHWSICPFVNEPMLILFQLTNKQ